MLHSRMLKTVIERWNTNRTSMISLFPLSHLFVKRGSQSVEQFVSLDVPESPVNPPGRTKSKLSNQASTQKESGNESTSYLLHPDGNGVFYWMGLVSLAIIYNYWTVILRIAFSEVRVKDGSDLLFFTDWLVDVIYLCDIGVQMRTAFMMDGIPVFDPLKIRKNYMQQPIFTRDAISVLPSETLALILPCLNGLHADSSARLNRLLKFHTLYRFYDMADSRTSNPNGIRAFKLSLSLTTVIHWIGCLYYIVSEYEGLGINNWVYTNDTAKQNFVRKYVVCLYWSAMTLTTIGDCNPPESDLEYAVTGLTFLIGVFVFATVVGNVGDVISNMNATRQEFQSKMDQIKLYLTHRKVPASLQIKVKKWAEYSWSRTQATDEYRLLHMLPERLRAEIAVHVHLNTLCKVKIFEHCEREFLCELVLKLRSQIYSPKDFICRAGETGREMFIINHGKVEVVVVNPVTGDEVVVASLNEGNYFGEISLLRLDGVPNKRTADVRSIGYSELLCLSRKDLMTALVEYPEAKLVLEEQARERIRNNMQAKRTFSVDNFTGISIEDDNTHEPETTKKEKDLTELRALIEDLRKTRTEISEDRLTALQTKCLTLTAQLVDRETHLLEALQRIEELETDLLSHNATTQNEWSKEAQERRSTDIENIANKDEADKNTKKLGTEDRLMVVPGITINNSVTEDDPPRFLRLRQLYSRSKADFMSFDDSSNYRGDLLGAPKRRLGPKSDSLSSLISDVSEATSRRSSLKSSVSVDDSDE